MNQHAALSQVVVSTALFFIPVYLQDWRHALAADAPAYVAGRILVPAIGSATFALAAGALPFLACRSPLNRIFLDLFEVRQRHHQVVLYCLHGRLPGAAQGTVARAHHINCALYLIGIRAPSTH